MNAILASQAVVFSLMIPTLSAHQRDGTRWLARSRPMDLSLPIAPRATWGARLAVHLIIVFAALIARRPTR